MKISIEAVVKPNIGKVWSAWTTPSDINQWTAARNDWHNPRSVNDLRVDGRFSYRTEAKDGHMGFDFEGIYTDVVLNKQIECILEDWRAVSITFEPVDGAIRIVETFEVKMPTRPRCRDRVGEHSQQVCQVP